VEGNFIAIKSGRFQVYVILNKILLSTATAVVQNIGYKFNSLKIVELFIILV
jgi:hypothetical protein